MKVWYVPSGLKLSSKILTAPLSAEKETRVWRRDRCSSKWTIQQPDHTVQAVVVQKAQQSKQLICYGDISNEWKITNKIE